MLRSTMYEATAGSFWRFRISLAAAPRARRLLSSRRVTASAEDKRSPESTRSRMASVRPDMAAILQSCTMSAGLHGLGERELDHLIRRTVAHENASHRTLLPEDDRPAPPPVNSKLKTVVVARFEGVRQIVRRPVVHLADKEPAVGGPVHEERALTPGQRMNASALEMIAHHGEVEDARPERQALLDEIGLQNTRAFG